ncbi:MAG: response regulator [Lentisphaeraceae bacterium]|nr:response regulator [Lentisphaeraceae bacterium]
MDKRLLLVDDEQSILDMLEVYFKEQTDWQVTLANSAEEAMKILLQRRFPIIVTDLKMPQMSGMDLCNRVRESNPLSYIIAMTGYQDFFELKNCREVGFDDYFKKPFNFNELLEEVESAHRKMSRWDHMLTN